MQGGRGFSPRSCGNSPPLTHTSRKQAPRDCAACRSKCACRSYLENRLAGAACECADDACDLPRVRALGLYPGGAERAAAAARAGGVRARRGAGHVRPCPAQPRLHPTGWCCVPSTSRHSTASTSRCVAPQTQCHALPPLVLARKAQNCCPGAACCRFTRLEDERSVDQQLWDDEHLPRVRPCLPRAPPSRRPAPLRRSSPRHSLFHRAVPRSAWPLPS